MGMWLFRAGKNGKNEEKFLSENKVYLTWDGLNINLSKYDKKRFKRKT